MKVPFLDVGAQTRELKTELNDAFNQVIDSGCFIGGNEVEAFESEFATYCHTRHCVGVGNGYDGIFLILKACGIGPGDEVIVPAHTFIATWLAVSSTGALPVPVEVDETTRNIDPERISASISSSTRAIIPAHLYGQPADMDKINDIASQNQLILIEDAAQAHGGRYKGRSTGSLAHAAAFSFYPAKNLGALGDGGAVVTNDKNLAARVRMLGNYGSELKYRHVEKGCNSRLDPIQAALLRVKMRYLDTWNARRKQIANAYLNSLHDLIELGLPFSPDWAEPCWHLFVVQHPDRDGLQDFLNRAGIKTLIHYPIPPHLSKAYEAEYHARTDFKITEALCDSVLSLPIGPHLSDEQVDYVIKTIRSFAVQRSDANSNR
jgi:dTDP-4-amino-4,6-dideoxygalactose transaminase